MKQYIPSPVDTSDIELPSQLMPLIEDMARNVHAVRAINSMEGVR